MNDKIVSVIIPNYNHASFLKQRIESVFQQTYTNFEIIILDDGSSDDSVVIINQFAEKDNRIKFIENSINSGSPFIQWNKGVAMAKGEFIWIAESDDMADQIFLETMVRQLDNNSSAALTYCQSYKMDDKNNTTGTWKEWTDGLDKNIFKEDFVMNGGQYIERFLIHKNTIPNASAVVFRRSVYTEAGGANEHIQNCSDWLTWLKMLLQNDVAFVAKPLNYFRYHEGSVIAKAHTKHNDAYEEEFDYLMRKAFENYLVPFNDPLIKKIRKSNDRFIFHSIGNYGLYNFRSGKKIKGLHQILQASIHPAITLNFIKRLLFIKSARA